MTGVIVETTTEIMCNIIIVLLGMLGAWLAAKLSRHQKLKTIQTAADELISAAEQTVMELQQTVVDGLKEASADGKLNEKEIRDLGIMLKNKTLNKLSDPALNVLAAAQVDIDGMIKSAGEAMILKMKQVKRE